MCVLYLIEVNLGERYEMNGEKFIFDFIDVIIYL